jgi:hypothetical protein
LVGSGMTPGQTAGQTVRVVEVAVGGAVLLMETSAVQVAGTQQTGAGDKPAEWLLKSFERAQEAIEQIAVSTAEMIGRAARRSAEPDVVQVELGLKISAKGDIIIAGSSGEASLKVTLTYNSTRSVHSGGAAIGSADEEPGE